MAKRRLVAGGLATVLLLAAACGGGNDDEPTAAATAEAATTTTTPPEPAFDGNVLQLLDYPAALPTTADLKDLLPGNYVTENSRKFSRSRLLGQCGQPQTDHFAAAGHVVVLADSAPSLNIVPAVLAFEGAEKAKEAFAATRAVILPCRNYTENGDAFGRVQEPSIASGGDEQVSLFARKTATRLLVGDYFVRRGPFVLSVRFSVMGNSPFDERLVGRLAESATSRFVEWADAQLRKPKPGTASR